MNQFLLLIRYFGLWWLVKRTWYVVKLKLGWLEFRMPKGKWSDYAVKNESDYFAYRRNSAPVFLFSPEAMKEVAPILKQFDGGENSTVAAADRILSGDFLYFFALWHQIGFPPNWHFDPVSKRQWSSKQHWSKIGDFGDSDIKLIWEPSRFGFVYLLARAYWRTRDEKYAEGFWRLFENWCEKNPPNSGPNWKCGQEAAIRLMAVCFGLNAFLHCKSTTPSRVALCAAFANFTGKRIAGNIRYAIDQRNNHGVSEAVGLWTVGLLFPEFKDSKRYRYLGQRYLERLGAQLISADGSFSQHSNNYHRLMLHDYLWVVRLGELNGHQFSPALKTKLLSAVRFLHLQVADSGRVPNTGANDGAYILPLSNCDYSDYRPVLQAAWYLLNKKRLFESGPWDEDLFWLFGPDSLISESVGQNQSAFSMPSGYHGLKGQSSAAFVRCGKFVDRPGQCDLLHTDLWWRGHNIALDPGSYSYHAKPPFSRAFADAFVHNTVTVDQIDQMQRFSKFVLLPWVKGQTDFNGQIGGHHYWEGSHDAYLRLPSPVAVSRGVLQLPNDTWLVLDRLISEDHHDYRLHWLLNDFAHKMGESSVQLEVADGIFHLAMGTGHGSPSLSIVRASTDSNRGWKSQYYYRLDPALSLEARVRQKSTFFWSIFSPQPARVDSEGDFFSIQSGESTYHLDLNGLKKSGLIIRNVS